MARHRPLVTLRVAAEPRLAEGQASCTHSSLVVRWNGARDAGAAKYSPGPPATIGFVMVNKTAERNDRRHAGLADHQVSRIAVGPTNRLRL